MGGSGWARQGPNLSHGRCPAPTRWSSGTPRPHCLATAGRTPCSRSREGAPRVGTGGSGEKSEARSWAAAAAERLLAALGGARLCEKRAGGGCSVRKVLGGAQRRSEGRRASCGQSRRATPGEAPSGLGETELVAFAPPMASWAGLKRSRLTLPGLGEPTSPSSEAGGLRLAGQRRGSRLSPSVVLRISPLSPVFLFFSAHFCVQKPGKLAGVFTPVCDFTPRAIQMRSSIPPPAPAQAWRFDAALKNEMINQLG